MDLSTEELIATLHYCGDSDINPCADCLMCKVEGCLTRLMQMAAVRLEELTKGDEPK